MPKGSHLLQQEAERASPHAPHYRTHTHTQAILADRVKTVKTTATTATTAKLRTANWQQEDLKLGLKRQRQQRQRREASTQ